MSKIQERIPYAIKETVTFVTSPFLHAKFKGFERSEQNNPVSCFVNGDRSILRDVTLNYIQNVEQNTRTNPLRRAKKRLVTLERHSKGQFSKNTVYLEKGMPYFVFVDTNAVLVKKINES